MKKSILNPILLLVLPMLSSLAQSQQRLASHVSVADTCYTNCPDDNHPHAIDLGLPSGTKWACCNVGATVPEGYGGYYSWGETEEKDSYDKNNYLHYDVSAGEYMDIGQYICGTDYDVAHVRWGESWQMPMYEQIKELASLFEKIKSLNLDIDKIKQQAETVYNRLQELGENVESAKGILEKIVDFFESIANSIANLFN